MFDEGRQRALQKAEFEARKLGAEVERLKHQLRVMRQDLRRERADHRQTALKLQAVLDAAKR